jgi:hypothetical protein
MLKKVVVGIAGGVGVGSGGVGVDDSYGNSGDSSDGRTPSQESLKRPEIHWCRAQWQSRSIHRKA